MKKKIYKSKCSKKICGVCGGLGEYLDIDPTIIRLIWAITILAWGSGIIAYFLAAIIMDEEPDTIDM